MRPSLIATLILFLVLLPGNAIVRAQETAGKIDALVTQYLDYGKFNGSLLVAENGQVIIKKGYGYANIEWEVPNTTDTKFRIASITKQFTAMLVMRQVERGKIGLDEPMAKYLPDYPKEQGEKVTIRQLLNHTSGIPSYTEIRSPRDPRQARIPWERDSLIGVFSHLPLEFQPGTKMKYNNSGYFLLGAVLEKVTGKGYEQLLQEEILTPCGMKNSGYDHAAPILKKRAAGYERAGEVRNAEYLDMSIPYAAGAMYSTVEDFLLWDQALYSGKLISAKSEAEYYRPGLANYAFGWVVQNMAVGKGPDSVLTISHAGGINGFNTLIVRAPARKLLIVLLNNVGGAPLTAMASAILGILHDRPYALPKRPAARELERVIAAEGTAKAVGEFDRMKAQADSYDVNENDMNVLGYRFLQEGKVKEAIVVFKMNVGAFPGSWNVYDSLGEAYMADGRTDLAIANYERSVELNPKNEGGKKALQELKGRKSQ